LSAHAISKESAHKSFTDWLSERILAAYASGKRGMRLFDAAMVY
jgi:hypothetical protein